MENYYPSEIVKFTHGFPHISFKFVWLQNPEFTFDDPSYLESLVMVAIVPLVILSLSMIGFFVYFCCVKIKGMSSNKADTSSCYCSVCLIIIFVMIALGSIGIMAYSSVQIHEGVNTTLVETAKLNQSFAIVAKDSRNFDFAMSNLNKNVIRFDNTSVNRTEVDILKKIVTTIDELTDILPYRNSNIEIYLPMMKKSLEDIEKYRTITTFSLIGIQGLICFFALLGICFRSRCLLINAVFLGLLCLVISYLFIGITLMVDVATADLCIDPYEYINKQAINKLDLDNETVKYYLVCSPNSVNYSYKKICNNISDGILILESIITNSDLSDDSILDDLYSNAMQLQKLIRSLSIQLDCQPINVALKQIVYSVCFFTFDGFFILSIAAVSVCLALTVILCAAPQTWKRFSKQEDTEELDLDDVFLPPPVRQPSISRTNNPLYISPEGRYSTRVSNSASPPMATNTLSFFRRSEEDMTLLDQPPPEYSPPRPGSDY